MPHHPRWPREQLALAYIEALERWELPGATVRTEFGLSVKRWERLRSELSRDGWLPAAMPPWRGPTYRAEASQYAVLAREVLARKLSQRMDLVRQREAAQAARQVRSQRRIEQSQRAQSRRQFAAVRREELWAARERERSSGAVLDVFL